MGNFSRETSALQRVGNSLQKTMMSALFDRRPLAFILAMFLVGLQLHSHHPALAGDAAVYRLDTSDKIRIKVFEWRPTTDQVVEWKSMNDTYIVGPAGDVSISLLGDVSARGRTLSEFSRRIGIAMRDRMKIDVLPNIAVEIVEYRPIFITGDVQKPGAYPFQPGLTTIKAVAVAGGLGRRDESSRRVGRELISTEGDLELNLAERRSLMARRARLEAEISGRHKITYPTALDGKNAGTQAIMRREAALFSIEKRSFEERLETLARRKERLQKEVETVRAQMKNHEKQMKLARLMLKNIEDLMSRNLTIKPRHMNAQRNVYQLESVGLRLSADLRVILENIANVEATAQEVRNQRRSTAIQRLRETDLRISQLTRRIETLERLYVDTARLSRQAAYGRKISYSYTIRRQGTDAGKKIVANEATFIRPGDTIEVEIMLPDNQPEPLSSSSSLPDPTQRAPTTDRRKSAPAQPIPSIPKSEVAATKSGAMKLNTRLRRPEARKSTSMTHNGAGAGWPTIQGRGAALQDVQKPRDLAVSLKEVPLPERRKFDTDAQRALQ